MKNALVTIIKNLMPVIVLLFSIGYVRSAVLPNPRFKQRELREHLSKAADSRESVLELVADLDEVMNAEIAENELSPSPEASDLQLSRRLTLALMGTIPSLEELRWLEKRQDETAIWDFVTKLLADPRFSSYFAERWVRAILGNRKGPDIVFRRRRFVSWLTEQFAKNRRFDDLVREMVSGTGLWTDNPATNFMMVSYDGNIKDFRKIEIAGGMSKAFLGIRLDCAECHDHPFEDWSREDFHGFAAYFGQASFGIRGVSDDPLGQYQRLEIDGSKGPVIDPVAPFQKKLIPTAGSRRQQIAAWLTHPENRYFSRAIVNRTWALMFGRAIIEPLDELPKGGPFPKSLSLLAKDFSEHNFDLRRLVKVIALSQAFRRDSIETQQQAESSAANSRSVNETAQEKWQASDEETDLQYNEVDEIIESLFARFPLTQLRPEQMIGSVIQSSSLSTIDRDSLWFTRFQRVAQQSDFLKRYGDLGQDNFTQEAGTIPQRLLLMNGKIVKERIDPDPFSLVAQLNALCEDEEQLLDCLYLAVLTRHPSQAEKDYFLAQLKENTVEDARLKTLVDIHWTLINCSESSWNH